MVNHLVETISENEGVGESEPMRFHRMSSLHYVSPRDL